MLKFKITSMSCIILSIRDFGFFSDMLRFQLIKYPAMLWVFNAKINFHQIILTKRIEFCNKFGVLNSYNFKCKLRIEMLKDKNS